MLSSHSGFSSPPLLTNSQGVHWSNQRILALGSQLFLLVMSVLLVVNVSITLGERRLQEEWATQRYSELQTIGAMIADKVSFQQFRAQNLASGELLRQYLETGDKRIKQRLLQQWAAVHRSAPELMGIALYNAKGEFMFASSNEFDKQTLPSELLSANRNMGGRDIYSSPMELLSVNGKLEPYMYQLAWLEAPDHSVRGYLVTYNAMLRTLEMIKPAFSAGRSPIMLFDTQGVLYAGETDTDMPFLPDALNGSLQQSYPALWRKMATSTFGQFHGDFATFVYLKVDLTSQYETRRDYFLVSYIPNEDIANRFSSWHTILLVGAIMIGALACAALVLMHLYRIEQRARFNSIQLAADLFTGDEGLLLVNNAGRVLQANHKAGQLLNLDAAELSDRSLQRCLQLDDNTYNDTISKVTELGEWQLELHLNDTNAATLRVQLRFSRANSEKNHYFLISLSDISELVSCRQEESLQRLLADSAVATALTSASGALIKHNEAFEQLFDGTDVNNANLADILENDFSNQWPRICQLVAMQGSWQGQILTSGNIVNCLQATLKGHLDDEGEIEYMVCTLEQAKQSRERQRAIPYRSAVLGNIKELSQYFDALNDSSRQRASLMLIDISPTGILSHLNNMSELEKRQQEVEVCLLRDLPSEFQISHWQLGQIIIILPNTKPTQAHEFAIRVMELLQQHGSADAIAIGIAAYQDGQDLETFIGHADVALKRARQSGEHKICQAFTR